MRIVPVIDLMGGNVVAARGGRRETYRPIQTPLAPGSRDPLAVARGLLAIHPFAALYVADLDGIEGRGRDRATVRRLAASIAPAVLWVDDGAAAVDALEALLAIEGTVAVLGSETVRDLEHFRMLSAFAGSRAVLSLDFRGETFLGPRRLLEQPVHWPRTVIAMTLAAVGTNAGPDLGRIAELSRAAGSAGGREILAAGGLRNRADLLAARAAGASGALVASALHAGTIKAGDLDAIAGL